MTAEEECPLCLELMEPSDTQCFPCTCVYQVCKYCWYRILLSPLPVCPGCRATYNPSAALDQFHATWIAAVENVRCHKLYGQSAFELVNILAYVKPNTEIPTIIFQNADPEFENILQLLSSVALVIPSIGKKSFVISPTVQSKIRRFANEIAVLQKAMKLFVVALDMGIKEYLFHVAAIWNHALRHDPLVQVNICFFTIFCDKLDAEGFYDIYLETAVSSLPKMNQLFGPVHVNTLRTKSDIATAFWRLNRLEESMKCFDEVLPLARIHLGAEHWLTLVICNELALVKNRQGKSLEAIEILNDLCSGTALKYGFDHPETITAFKNKGTIMKGMQRYNEALAAFEQVLEAQRRSLGEDDEGTVQTRCTVAAILHKQNNHEAALEHRLIVLQKRKALLSPIDPSILETVYEAAFSLNALGRYQTALDICQEAAAVFKIDAVNVPSLRLQCQMARAFLGLNRKKEARLMYILTRKTRDILYPRRKGISTGAKSTVKSLKSVKPKSKEE